jgi:hypothetical protein
MHPELAQGLVEQRREELTRTTAETRWSRESGASWLSRHVPRWHVSWSRTVLSPATGSAATGSAATGSAATGSAAADGESPSRRGRGGSSLVIIISAHR